MPTAKTRDPIVIKKKNRTRKVFLFPVTELAMIECTCWAPIRANEGLPQLLILMIFCQLHADQIASPLTSADASRIY
jgi:hypothetical protein